jgi:UDPglucose 6-dehydrogenase
MKITMIGTGYVGLVTGSCLAEVGNDVMCLDVDARKIGVLQSGGVPIHEPGLEPMIRRNVAAGRLHFTTDIDAAVGHATVQFIAVGTPPDDDGSADMQYVLQAARDIGRRITQWTLVVDKSTVPVGTADRVRAAIGDELAARGVDVPYAVASNPEFLKEGAAIDDFMKPDRVVIGAEDERAIGILRNVYAPFQRNRERLLVMDVRSAELTKYAANAMLATRISFMNELANLAERLGADIESVRQGIGSDPRIGWHFLYPGVGYGGSCFPKDVKALQHTAERAGAPLQVLAAVEAANDAQKRVLVDKIVGHFGDDLSGRRFALWGLAFKPNTDDMREAPSRVIVDALARRGASICAYDPVAIPEARRVMGDMRALSFSANPMAACEGADALVVVTEWKEFRSPDFDALRRLLKAPLIFDGRNLYEPHVVHAAGFRHFAIGRSVPGEIAGR